MCPSAQGSSSLCGEEHGGFQSTCHPHPIHCFVTLSKIVPSKCDLGRVRPVTGPELNSKLRGLGHCFPYCAGKLCWCWWLLGFQLWPLTHFPARDLGVSSLGYPAHRRAGRLVRKVRTDLGESMFLKCEDIVAVSISSCENCQFYLSNVDSHWGHLHPSFHLCHCLQVCS